MTQNPRISHVFVHEGKTYRLVHKAQRAPCKECAFVKDPDGCLAAPSWCDSKSVYEEIKEQT